MSLPPYTPWFRHGTRTAVAFVLQMGLDPRRTYAFFRGLVPYVRSLCAFRRLRGPATSSFPIRVLYPCVGEAEANAGVGAGHYFHQDLLVARKIHTHAPEKHVDVGSRIDGLVAHVAAFREIEVLDIRPLPAVHPHICFTRVDVMDPHFPLSNYCDSVSSLHAVEHFGLGRYGDVLDPDGHLKGLANIQRMLRSGGKFYFSVPIGEQRIEYNAHRVFSVAYLVDLLNAAYVIDEFSFVDDRGELHVNAPLTATNLEQHFHCIHGCGIFELTKK